MNVYNNNIKKILFNIIYYLLTIIYCNIIDYIIIINNNYIIYK